MQLHRVWLIYRSGSQTAQRQARRCAEELKLEGVGVSVAASRRNSAPMATPIGPPSSLPTSRLTLKSTEVVLALPLEEIEGDSAE